MHLNLRYILFTKLRGYGALWKTCYSMRLRQKTESQVQQQLLLRLEPLFNKDDYQIVELTYALLKHRAHFQIVLFHPQGVSLDACAELHKIADVEIERLQASGTQVSPNKDYYLELSSPGLFRPLRSLREFQVFRGQRVRCMVDNHWYSGTLLNLADDGTGQLELSLLPQNQNLANNLVANVPNFVRFPLEQVIKVVLDSENAPKDQTAK